MTSLVKEKHKLSAQSTDLTEALCETDVDQKTGSLEKECVLIHILQSINWMWTLPSLTYRTPVAEMTLSELEATHW